MYEDSSSLYDVHEGENRPEQTMMWKNPPIRIGIVVLYDTIYLRSRDVLMFVMSDHLACQISFFSFSISSTWIASP